MMQMMPAQENDDSQEVDNRLASRFAWVFGVLAIVLAGFVIWAGGDWRLALSHAQRAGKVSTEAYVKWGMWWAGLVNAGLCGLLALTTRWWTVKRKHAQAVTARVIAKREWAWLFVVLIMAGGLRWVRMDLSFYNDEAHTFRTYVAGRFRQSDDGQVSWRQVKWLDTLWLNKVGNNLMPCSLFGRASYDAWRKFTHAPDGAVCESAVRLPQWIAGMMALVVMWLAARRMLGGRAAALTVLLMALHPWALRYSTEARAYGMLMLGVALCFYFLQRAIEDGRWRWWLGLGLAEFFCVWSFPGSVFFLVVFNGAILIRGIYRTRKGDSGDVVLRPLVGMLVGGMVALQIMLPATPQLADAMNLNSLKGTMGVEWWADALGGMFWGIRGLDADPANPLNLALARMLAQQPLLGAALVIELALFVAGLVVLVARGGAGRVLALAGVLAMLLAWAAMTLQGKYLHPWYVIYTIPGVVLNLTAGAVYLENKIHTNHRYKFTGWLAVLIVGLAWLEVDVLYARRSKENLRGVVEVAHGESLSQGGQRGLFAAMMSDVDIYDPRALVLKDEAGLDALAARARKEGTSLTVSVGHLGIGETGAVFKKLKESGEFDFVTSIWGLEESQFTHHVFRWRDGR